MGPQAFPTTSLEPKAHKGAKAFPMFSSGRKASHDAIGSSSSPYICSRALPMFSLKPKPSSGFH